MGAVILLEKHKKIPCEIGFIKPYNSNNRLQCESWKASGGECGSDTGRGWAEIQLERSEFFIQTHLHCDWHPAQYTILSDV